MGVFLLGCLSILVFSIFCLTDPQVRDNAYFPLVEVSLPNFLTGNFMESIFSLFGVPKSIGVFFWICYILTGLIYLNQIVNPLKNQQSMKDKSLE